ncbi:hypothetical protein LCM02_02935 [Lutimonas saemankumensis]|uniref:TolB family protein n=1 Tax=Lutimonas saemankumensis TaxID=483016 RepID=UPI001CD26039|nr:hypothetical protein [Lutimonas saemankumensis]MCA0931392.1 hypothetical protein [Lutimonas saemankumensis]
MKFKIISLLILILSTACLNNKRANKTEPSVRITHPYRIDSIIEKPVKFYPEMISTNIDKFNTSMSPDGRTIYYTATSQKLGITGIAYQKFEEGNFGSPEFVPFVWADTPMSDVQISPDGNLMLFSTFKDFEGKPDGFNFNIWVSEFKNGSWQDPTPFGSPITSSGNEFYPVMTKNRSIYFSSDKSGNSDIYFSRFENGEYQKPVRLPDNINTDKMEADAFISVDESFIIFVRVDEPDGYGKSDLYISFREDNMKWSDPVNMGEGVNSNEIDGSPYVTPDGMYLIFTSGRKQGGIKEKAAESYENFKSIISSSENGSLNFYIMSLKLDQYKTRE